VKSVSVGMERGCGVRVMTAKQRSRLIWICFTPQTHIRLDIQAHTHQHTRTHKHTLTRTHAHMHGPPPRACLAPCLSSCSRCVSPHSPPPPFVFMLPTLSFCMSREKEGHIHTRKHTHTSSFVSTSSSSGATPFHCITLQHVAAHCNTMQYTARLQHTASKSSGTKHRTTGACNFACSHRISAHTNAHRPTTKLFFGQKRPRAQKGIFFA